MNWIYVAPDPWRDLAAPPSPKQLWKYKQHAIRWERRYGKPLRFFTGELGRIDGIRIITEPKAA